MLTGEGRGGDESELRRNADARSDSLASYIMEGGHRQVEGWIEDGALSLLALLNAYQFRHEITGAVAEIGVHHGRCYIALSGMRRDTECGVAVDVFENQALNPDGSGRGDHAKFMANLRRFRVDQRQTVLSRDSLTLDGREIVEAAMQQRVRLFSVDGSHTARHTANDLGIAEDALAPEGVVILDDWFNPDWPGVQEGFFAFMRRRGVRLAPFAYGNSKLLLSYRDERAKYFAFVEDSVRRLAQRHKLVELCGFPCHYIQLPAPSEIAAVSGPSDTTELDVRNPAPQLGHLGEGWAQPEAWGRWTVGPRAEVILAVPPGQGEGFELRAELASFRGGDRPDQIVTVRAEGKRLGEWLVDNSKLQWKKLDFALTSNVARQQIGFELSFSTTRSPRSLGLSEDDRELGVRASNFALSRKR